MNAEKQYKIIIDPSMLKILGQNMYKNIYFILGELIANAWDADAKNVYIFIDQDKVILEDDGSGMSYSAGDIEKYLVVGQETRTNAANSLTPKFQRKKMGRKGLGKLAALSLADPVKVMSLKLGEKSGFELTRNIDKSGMLKGLKDSEIKFKFIKNNGTAIVMENPKYVTQKDPHVIAKNISRIFPFTDENFLIHVIKDVKHPIIIKNAKETITSQLATIITLGKEFEDYSQNVNPDFVINFEEAKVPLSLINNEGKQVTKDLILRGWIGTYKSTSGRKTDILDFQDNFISIYANGKIGEFNILEKVGKNTMTESYVVGEIHADLFEDSDLPDMAVSNREGYITSDLRYEETLKEIRKLLDQTIRLRKLYTDDKHKDRKNNKLKKQKKLEEELRDKTKVYKKEVVDNIYDLLKYYKVSEQAQKEIIDKTNITIENNQALLGLKSKIDVGKKKILLSHTTKDKFYVDLIYSMLVFNNLPEEEILYTNSENEKSRVPQGISVFDYLREFFVNSISNEQINVTYITSTKMNESWRAVSEVGAGWITQSNHNIFNISNDKYQPKTPLNINPGWNETILNYETEDITMNNTNADDFCSKIEMIVYNCGYQPNNREKNRKWLERQITII